MIACFMKKKSQFRKESGELGFIIKSALLLTLPSVFAYYFCRDFDGRGNSPENAPVAAIVTLVMWLPVYYASGDLSEKTKRSFDRFCLLVFGLLTAAVVLNAIGAEKV